MSSLLAAGCSHVAVDHEEAMPLQEVVKGILKGLQWH